MAPDCRSKVESFGRTACCVEHFVEKNACRSNSEARREFRKYDDAAGRLAELEALTVTSQALDMVQGDNEEVACRRWHVLFQLEPCPRGSLFKQFCPACYSAHKLECSLTLDGNKRSDANSQLAAMVFNRMVESEDDKKNLTHCESGRPSLTPTAPEPKESKVSPSPWLLPYAVCCHNRTWPLPYAEC
jgi:hypothetical protein